MEQNKKISRKAISIVLSVLMVMSCFSGLSLTAFAAAETWSADKTFSGDKTYNDEIVISNNMTLTLDGCDVTINGGIYADGKTLTIKGTGALYVTGVRKEGSQTYGHGIRGNVIVDGAKLIVTGADRGYGIMGTLDVKGSDAWVEVYGGSGGDPQSAGQGSAGLAGVSGNVTVEDGTVLIEGGAGGNARSDVTKIGGGGGMGISGSLTVNGGFVSVTGGSGGNGSNGANGGLGNYAVSYALTVNSGTVNATGGNGGNNKSNNAACARAIIATIRKESSDGNSWSDISGETSTKQYVKANGHGHNFTYSANGATITATCSADGCPLTDKKATLTIAAPSNLTYDGAAKAAVITDANKIQGDAKVQYQTKSGSTYGTASETAPTNAGNYKASITLGGVTASVEYTIAKADPTYTVPSGLSATYGDTLANVTLPTGWAWVNTATGVGAVGTKTFKANFTPSDTSNYNVVNNVDVTVKVNKAANPATVTNAASVVKGGKTVDLSKNVTLNGATGAVIYEIVGETNGCTLEGSVLTSGSNAGTVTVSVTVAADDNYNALGAKDIAVTISDKENQNITVSGVVATYGDTDKAISATTDGDGKISYSVNQGVDIIDIDKSTGAITTKKAGFAVVLVMAAETDTYNKATAMVLVQVNKAESTPATVEAKTLVYSGEEQELVTVTGDAIGGEMQYALGENAQTAPDKGWGTAVPTGTEIDTYYLWYKVVGDENHNDSDPACVEVKITDLVGWQEIEGQWYYYGDDGVMQTGWVFSPASGKWFYLDEDGVMQTGWIKSEGSGQWFYLKASGAMATGWCKVDGIWYYFKESGAMTTGWQKVNDTWYYLKASGAMATGWQKINGTWYYFKESGAMATGWQKVNGTWYYLNANGSMRTANLTYKGKVYRFSSSGACLNP